MRQLLYVSTSTAPADQVALNAILDRSRHNNALDGITGLLWSDGHRFAQVLEGDDRAIADAMARIHADPRHHQLKVLHDRSIAERQFGDWSMALRHPGIAGDAYDLRMRQVLDRASAAVRETFAGLITSVPA